MSDERAAKMIIEVEALATKWEAISGPSTASADWHAAAYELRRIVARATAGRAECYWCGQSVQLRIDQTVRSHRDPFGDDFYCKGSRQPPKAISTPRRRPTAPPPIETSPAASAGASEEAP